jgi:hypothetical protein
MEISYTKDGLLGLQYYALIAFDQFIICIKILRMITFKTANYLCLDYTCLIITFNVVGTEHTEQFMFSMKNIIL